jgi:Tfp pilus assembly protein PilV
VRNAHDPAPPADEEGFAIIEVLISALIIVIVGGAVLTLLQATARSAGDSRNRTAAQAIAQEDQARLRSMRISSLNRLNQSWTAKIGGTTFTINSTGSFVNNATGNPSCTGSNTSADYVRITSTVTWPSMNGRPPVVTQSIIAPSNGSLNPGNGTLTVSTINAAGLPLPGVGLSGTGAGTFSGTTDSEGCANFADLPAGSYTLTPTAAGLVDKDGNAPAAESASVSASSTLTRVLQYDKPGALEVNFKYRVGSTGEFKPSSASAIRVFNTTMTSALTVSAPGGNPAATIATQTSPAKLFPFTSPYAVYAGTCSSNNPNPESNPEAPGGEKKRRPALRREGARHRHLLVRAQLHDRRHRSSARPGAALGDLRSLRLREKHFEQHAPGDLQQRLGPEPDQRNGGQRRHQLDEQRE